MKRGLHEEPVEYRGSKHHIGNVNIKLHFIWNPLPSMIIYGEVLQLSNLYVYSLITLGCTSQNSIQYLYFTYITYNNLILIDNVVQTMDDETNNILSTTRQTGHTWQELWTSVKIWCDECLHTMYR